MDTIVVSVNEAAKALGIGRSKVYLLAQSNDLKLIKIGRRSLITIDSIRSLVSGGEA